MGENKSGGVVVRENNLENFPRRHIDAPVIPLFDRHDPDHAPRGVEENGDKDFVVGAAVERLQRFDDLAGFRDLRSLNGDCDRIADSGQAIDGNE